MNVKLLARVVLLTMLLASGVARAALTIEIVGGGERQIPVGVVPFANEDRLSQSITQVVAADLQRSGLFRMVDGGGMRPSEPAQVNYPDWKGRGAEAIVIGSTNPLPDGRVEVRFRLMDVVRQSQLTGFVYTIAASQLRLTAHKIADAVYEKLTGDTGVFATRIAYVVKQGKRYELQVADADGFNAQTVVASNEPIISPSWAPDGERLAYVSFEDKKPVVYVQSLTSGSRKPVASFKGSNSAPAWSPDGRKLAVVLSMMGGSQIFVIDLDKGGMNRLMQSPSIDTEPNFSPDGQWILFTSDRGGSPQLYRIPVAGGAPQRVTFEGSYNVSGRYGPDGKSIAFITRNGGRFNVAVQDVATRQVQLLTDNPLDESPSFAPNGKIILYASELNGRGILAAVSSDGRVKQRLTSTSGDIREPAWGPLMRSEQK
jgi:TolB protein